MVDKISFDLNNPPLFDLNKLFSIDALVNLKVCGAPTDFYEVIHRLPDKIYSKGSIFVVVDELGLPLDTRAESYDKFENEIARLNRGQIVGRPATQKVACPNVIIPENELTLLTILNTIREYSTIEDIVDVKCSYRNMW